MMRGFEDIICREMFVEFILFNLDKRRLRENMRSLLCKNLLQTGQWSIAFSWLLDERRINLVNLRIKVRAKDIKAYQTVTHWNKLATDIFFLEFSSLTNVWQMSQVHWLFFILFCWSRWSVRSHFPLQIIVWIHKIYVYCTRWVFFFVCFHFCVSVS